MGSETTNESRVDAIKYRIDTLSEEELKEVQRYMYQTSDNCKFQKEIMQNKCRIIYELNLNNIHALDGLDDNTVWKIISLLNERESGARDYAMLHQELKTIKAVTHWDRDYLGIAKKDEHCGCCCEPMNVKECCR